MRFDEAGGMVLQGDGRERGGPESLPEPVDVLVCFNVFHRRNSVRQGGRGRRSASGDVRT
jgi:hypothetical protein